MLQTNILVMMNGAFKSDTEVYTESEDYFCMIAYSDRLVHMIVFSHLYSLVAKKIDFIIIMTLMLVHTVQKMWCRFKFHC